MVYHVREELESFMSEQQEPSIVEIDRETGTYLVEIEKNLYTLASTREKIDAGLLFVSCQFSSVSIAWLLYSIQVSLIPVSVIASAIALLPGLIQISDSFGFSLNSEKWELHIQQKPLAGFVKLGLGLVTSYCGTAKIIGLESQSKSQIETAYNQIERPAFNVSIPTDLGILAVVLLSLAGLYVKFKLFTTKESNEKQ
jgi:hypothetical protein